MPGRWDAIVFDKDGTLLDFEKTYASAVGGALRRTAPDDHAFQAAAGALGYDPEHNTFALGAPVVHASNPEIVAMLAPFLDGWAMVNDVLEGVREHLAAVPNADAVLHTLHGSGTPLAVATNDEEAASRDQLAALGWAELFNVVVGYDSGHGTKPDPGMVLHAVERLDADPGRAAMVGDSEVDLLAARRAGMTAILVDPTGRHRDLADHWLSDLGELPALAQIE